MAINNHGITIQRGLPGQYLSDAAALYDKAFGQKFSVAVKSVKKRQSLLKSAFVSDYAIVALCNDELVGMAGFHTQQGSLTAGLQYNDLLSRLGFFAGNWAALIFSLYERAVKPNELLMDGIAVRGDFRGQGVGSQLLDALAAYATEQHYDHIRLDVIDINPGARRLYERKGFQAISTESFPYLKWLLGFSHSTTMILKVTP